MNIKVQMNLYPLTPSKMPWDNWESYPIGAMPTKRGQSKRVANSLKYQLKKLWKQIARVKNAKLRNIKFDSVTSVAFG